MRRPAQPSGGDRARSKHSEWLRVGLVVDPAQREGAAGEALAQAFTGRCNTPLRLHEDKIMKAVLFGHGGPEVLHLADVPDPVAGPGEVVVDIHAASVNAADYKVRLGRGATAVSGFPISWAATSRAWSARSVLASPISRRRCRCSAYASGDEEGAYAEKIAIKAAIVAKKPAGLGHAEAAAMALTSLTALWALEDTARLRRRRNHSHPGRCRRCRRLCDPARQASRRDA